MRSPSARPRYHLALLFLAGALNLFDRQIINVLSQSIETDLRISDFQLGLLTGTAFALLYSGLGIPLGRLGDRVDRIKLVSTALLVWSGFTSACGVVSNFGQLLFVRAGVGIGEAASQPASAALIADLFPGKGRTLAMSIFLLCVPVGSFLGLMFGGLIGSAYGWRTAFVIAGIPGLILAPLIFFTMSDPTRSRGKVGISAASALPADGTFRTIADLFARPGYLWIVLALTCCAFQVYASGAWMPAFFIRNHGMTTAQIGSLAGLAVGGGGALGALISGFLCDRFRHRVRDVESLALMLALGLTAPTIIAIVTIADRTIALCFLFLFNVFSFAYLGPGTTLLQKAAPQSSRSLAVALSTTIASITALGMGMPLIGATSDFLTPRFGARAVGIALQLCALAGVLGVFASWRGRKALAAQSLSVGSYP